MKGHRLETIAARGGLCASCSCGHVYPITQRPDAVLNGRTIVRPRRVVWDGPNARQEIHAAHKAHLDEVASQQ